MTTAQQPAAGATATSKRAHTKERPGLDRCVGIGIGGRGLWVGVELSRSPDHEERYPAVVVAQQQHQSVGGRSSLSLCLSRGKASHCSFALWSLRLSPWYLPTLPLSKRWQRSGRRWLATALPRNKVYWNVWASRRTRPSPRNYARRTRYRARDRLALSSERECELVAILMRRNSRWTGSVCRGDDVVLARDLQATA